MAPVKLESLPNWPQLLVQVRPRSIGGQKMLHFIDSAYRRAHKKPSW